jgi:hypothetical protein
VAVNVKIVRLQELGDIVIDFGVNQYRPYDCFFGFSAVRDAGCGGGGSSVFLVGGFWGQVFSH